MQRRSFLDMAGNGISDRREMEGHPAYPIRESGAVQFHARAGKDF